MLVDGGSAYLSVDGISRRFADRVVLDAVSFQIAAGQAYAVVGPNGGGKTTLLRCVVGADRPDTGEVRLDGRRFDDTDPAARAAVASVLDDIEFFGDLSVAEHLELLAYAHGVGASDDMDELLTELGLQGARDQLPPTLSSGQRRRLALASCFVRPRRLLVLDEPEQRLDQPGRRWLADRLVAEKRAGVAVLLASHDAELVETVADSTLRLGG